MASSSGSCGEPKPLQGLAGIIRSLDGWSLSGWRKVELIRLGRRPCSEHLNAACWASHTSQEQNLFVRNHPIFEGSPSTKGGGEDNFASPDRDGDSDGGAEGTEEEDLNWGCSEEEEDLNWGCSEEEEDLNWGCCAEEEEDSGWGCSEEEDDRVWGWCSEDSGSDAAEGKDAESEDDEVFDFFGSRRQQLSQRFPEQDLEEIERYVDRANFIYNGFDKFDVEPPKPLWCRTDFALYPLPFNDESHPLYENYKGRIDGCISHALSEYNTKMGQSLEFEETIWTNMRASPHDFYLYITFKAFDKLTGHYRDCRTEVYNPSYDEPRYFVEKFIRLPARDHIDAKPFRSCDQVGIHSSIEKTISSFLRKIGKHSVHPVGFNSIKCRQEDGTLHVYLSWSACESLIASDEIHTSSVFDAVVKYYLASGTSKVVSFSRRSQEGENRVVKPYVDLRDPGKLSLINKCAEAAVARYNKKMGADLCSPKVTRAYDFPAMGETAYHIAFKAKQKSTETTYICSARVIYDDQVKTWIRGENETEEYVLESFILHRDGWEGW